MKKYKRLFHLGWFTKSWWQYLLEPPVGRDKKYASRWTKFWCRAMFHPGGVWWYNPCGTEPDMQCKNCGDDLG